MLSNAERCEVVIDSFEDTWVDLSTIAPVAGLCECEARKAMEANPDTFLRMWRACDYRYTTRSKYKEQTPFWRRVLDAGAAMTV